MGSLGMFAGGNYGSSSLGAQGFRIAAGGSNVHPLIAAMGGTDWAWYDFSDTSTLWRDAASTIPAGVGDTVARIDDKSGNGFQGVVSGTATVVEAGGRTGLSFGTGAYVTAPGAVMDGDAQFYTGAIGYTQSWEDNGERYMRFYRVTDDSFGLYLDANSSQGTATLKQVRAGGTDNRANLKQVFRDRISVGDKVLLTAESGLTYSRLRWDGVDFDDVESVKANSGTALSGAGTDIQFPESFETVSFGAIFAPRELTFEQRKIAEATVGSQAGMAIWQPEIVAHRGFVALFPQNTLTAYAGAYAIDPSFLWEMDIQPSADGTPHLFHDETIDSLTDGTGTFTALTDAYIAARTVDDGTGETGSIPTLASLISYAQSLDPQPRIIFEIKETGPDANGFIDALMAQWAAAGLDHTPIATSFNLSDIQRVRVTQPDWPIGLIGSGNNATAISDLTALGGDLCLVWSQASINGTPAYATNTAAAGIDLYVWTVNETFDVSNLRESGPSITGYIANWPVGYLKIGQE